MKFTLLLLITSFLVAAELPGAMIKKCDDEKAKVTAEIDAKKHNQIVDWLMSANLEEVAVEPLKKDAIREEKVENEEKIDLNRRLKMLAGEVKHWKSPISKVNLAKVFTHEAVLSADFDRLYAKYKR